MKDLLRAVAHLALHNQPLTLQEMRELVLRHLLSSHSDNASKATTKHLFSTYLQMLSDDAAKNGGDAYDRGLFVSVDQHGITNLFREHYKIGITHGLSETSASDTICNFDVTYLPHNLPLDAENYPRDIIEQFGAVMGYLAVIGRQAA